MTVWPRQFLHIDYTKVFTTADRKISDSQQFSYTIELDRNNIPWTWTEWCKSNCTGVWGWWFNAKSCYIGFELQSDAIWFALTFQGDPVLQDLNR